MDSWGKLLDWNLTRPAQISHKLLHVLLSLLWESLLVNIANPNDLQSHVEDG